VLNVVNLQESPENVDHVMCDVIMVADERRCLLDNAASIISNKLSEFHEVCDRLDQWKTDSKMHQDEIVHHISTSADKLKSLIDQQQQQLTDDVDKMFTQRLHLITDVQSAISDQLPDLHHLLAR